MPVSLSGVMLGELSEPNGVPICRPPANGVPPGWVWQDMQSARRST